MTPLQDFGVSVEDSVIYELQQRGLDPDIPLNRLSAGADLMVGDIPIHVKAARRKYHKTSKTKWSSRYQFNFRNVDTRRDGFIIAVCASKAGNAYFVIPTWVAKKELKVVTTPWSYRGWAAPYLGAWQLVKQFDSNHMGLVYLTTSNH